MKNIFDTPIIDWMRQSLCKLLMNNIFIVVFAVTYIFLFTDLIGLFCCETTHFQSFIGIFWWVVMLVTLSGLNNLRVNLVVKYCKDCGFDLEEVKEQKLT